MGEIIANDPVAAERMQDRLDETAPSRPPTPKVEPEPQAVDLMILTRHMVRSVDDLQQGVVAAGAGATGEAGQVVIEGLGHSRLVLDAIEDNIKSGPLADEIKRYLEEAAR